MAVPAWWDGEAASLPNGGLDAVVEARFAEGTPEPTALCALQILIAPECRGEGLSSRMIRRMAEIGRDHGLDTLIAPVRPTLKHLYPLTPMERYIGWRRADGTHFDPWLRTHERLGAEIVKVAPQSTSAPGSVAEWEEWAQMAFPETGAYVVPGALVPVEIDRRTRRGPLRGTERLDGAPRQLNPHGTPRMPPDSIVKTEPSPGPVFSVRQRARVAPLDRIAIALAELGPSAGAIGAAVWSAS